MSNDAHEGLVIPLPASPIFKILQAMSANDMSALHAYATEFKNLSAPQQEVSDKPLAVLVREWNTWAEKQRTPSEAPVKVGTVHTAYKFEEIVYVIETLVDGEPPYEWANYFGFASGERCSNFWAENLHAAVPRFLPDGLVEILLWEYEHDGHKIPFTIIDDARIPDDWYYNKMCWTGSGKPPFNIAAQMYAVRGDPTNELEQFINPKSYYAKRNAEWSVHGTIRYLPRTPA